jgi:hypothetical protein
LADNIPIFLQQRSFRVFCVFRGFYSLFFKRFFRVFRVFRGLSDNPFNFHFRVMSEVGQKAKLHTCCLQVIVQLGTVFITDLFNRLEFKND